MKTLIMAAILTTLAGPVLAQDDPVIAIWSEDSGSLPPEYAWAYWVRFYAGGQVEVEYCKGYAEEAPGCATVQKNLSDKDQAAMQAELEPYAANLIENAPKNAPDDQIPIGGGSIGGWVMVGETKVKLPSFAAAEDAQRVTEVLAILQKYTPGKLVKKAERRSKQP